MLRAIQDGIRLPDGIVAVYTPVYIQYIPSPSRTMSIMDALLPVGILTTCLEGNVLFLTHGHMSQFCQLLLILKSQRELRYYRL